jgi:thiamine-phosphate pyrophosphorylase
LIGCSTHSLEEIAAAETAGADFVTFGPVYATPSKAAFGPPVGVDALRRACAAARIPVFALGGVGERNVGEVVAAGADGVAAISAVLAAEDPVAAAAEIGSRLAASFVGDRQGQEG